MQAPTHSLQQQQQQRDAASRHPLTPAAPKGLKAVGWDDEVEEERDSAAVAAAVEAAAEPAAEPMSKSKRKRLKVQKEAEVRAAELRRMEVTHLIS